MCSAVSGEKQPAQSDEALTNDQKPKRVSTGARQILVREYILVKAEHTDSKGKQSLSLREQEAN